MRVACVWQSLWLKLKLHDNGSRASGWLVGENPCEQQWPGTGRTLGSRRIRGRKKVWLYCVDDEIVPQYRHITVPDYRRRTSWVTTFFWGPPEETDEELMDLLE